jgi:hypothetical protein
MIPLRDNIPARHYPVVTHVLIAVNVLVFMAQVTHGPRELQEFVFTYGLVPARYTVERFSAYFSPFQQFFSFFSFMFLHGGFLHLIFNMWTLYIFGDNVEDRLGSFYYFIFYIGCGLVSGMAHFFLNLESTTPVIGASGAIAGVMGAYFLLYPGSKILTLIPIIFIPFFVEIPAFFFLGLWFLMQLLNAAGTQAHQAGIAWWAHIGGFVCGMLALKLFPLLPDGRAKSGHPMGSIIRKKSDRFQVIKPAVESDSADLYETIRITPYEAAAGATKVVNIPWGFHNRMYRLRIPPGTRDKSVLRLRGLGREDGSGQKGDLYLTVDIQQPW